MTRIKYLITGGAGFIGSHLAESLVGMGQHVTVLDDLSTGRIENLAGLEDRNGFRFVPGTVTDEVIVRELVDECDAVLHLAAAVGVQLIVSSPVRTIETNIAGTETVLRCADRGHKKLLLTSTSEIYGKKEEVPYKETDDLLLGPTTKSRWSYACSKAVDEFLALSYYRERSLPVIIVRLFNTVGPRQVGHYGMVIPRFVNQALDGGPITVYGDGKQSRCFAYVHDVIKGLTDLLENSSAVGEVFNVGNDEEISIEDLAGMVRDKVDPAIAIEHVPYSEAYEEGFEDMRRRIPDLSKVRAAIGYSPRLGISEILDRVIEHEKKKR